MHTAYQNNGTTRPLKRCFVSCFGAGYYTAVQINNYLKRTSTIKVPTMKIMDDFCYKHVCTTKSTLFMVSKDEWDTKEGTGKSMKSTFYEQRCLKRHLLG